MWQMGGVGPMFGQLGFFHKFAGKDYADKRPRDRYAAESQRFTQVRRVLDTWAERPAVQRGLQIPARPAAKP